MGVEEIADSIAALNDNLGLSAENARTHVRPIFQRGPKDRHTTWWVCAVHPAIYSKMLGHVFIGMSRCKVVEFFDYNQCLTCLKFGHQSNKCSSKVACPHCGVEGHRKEVCTKLQEEPKCRNCKGRHRATSKHCPKRKTALERVIRKTDFGQTKSDQ